MKAPSPLTIVIPMAGSGARFRNAGYELPKPFIDVKGKPMIQRVMENLNVPSATFVLIAQKENLESQSAFFGALGSTARCELVALNTLTDGAARTVLAASAFIDNERSLLIANSDQLVDIAVSEFIQDAIDRELDGSILTFEDPHRDPKWSFAAVNAEGFVTETREKKAISPYATVGLYWFKKGSLFVSAAKEMIAANDQHNNEFYVCPSFNYLIRRGLRIGIFPIKYSQMHGLGTPEDLCAYLAKNS